MHPVMVKTKSYFHAAARAIAQVAICAMLIATSKVAAAAASSGDSIPVFVGYMEAGGEPRFALREIGAGGVILRKGWFGMGEQFGGFLILDFEKKGEVLFVRASDQEILTLKLPTARVKQSELPEFSRDEAKRFLATLVEKASVKGGLGEIHLDFNIEQTLSDNERLMLASARDAASKTGEIVLAAKDGQGALRIARISPMPQKNLPKAMTANLTPLDWEEFNLEFAMASFQSTQRRRANGSLNKPR